MWACTPVISSASSGVHLRSSAVTWLQPGLTPTVGDMIDYPGVVNVGHCHPRVVAAIQEQSGRLMHVSNLYWNAPMVRLAERLMLPM
jgi:acetylornithine/succinyldiaminopimelate/putrescine aminotransferase